MEVGHMYVDAADKAAHQAVSLSPIAKSEKLLYNNIEKKIEIIDTEVAKIKESIEDIKDKLFDQDIKIEGLLDQIDTILKYEFNKESDK